jgi:outer membrane protein insertion porin family
MTPSSSLLSGAKSLFSRFSLFTSIILTSFSGIMLAQDYEGKKISEVSIRYVGSKTVDEARLRNLMVTKAGNTYRAENLDNDIKTLFESGLSERVFV